MSKMGHNIYGTSRNFGSMHLLMPPELVWMTVGTKPGRVGCTSITVYSFNHWSI